LKKWLKKVFSSPATTIPGVLTLAGVGFAAYADPKILADPKTIAAIGAGIGLLHAADSTTPEAN
jgi:hypothetical protein